MRLLSSSLSAVHLIPLSVFVFDTASASTALDDKASQPKPKLATQTPQKIKYFEIGNLEIMKMICTFRSSVSETATDQEIIEAVLCEIEKIKQDFPGGRLTFFAADAERHIKDAKNKRTFKRHLSESFKSFPKSFILDLKAFECEAEEEILTQLIAPESTEKENRNFSFGRKEIQKMPTNIVNDKAQREQSKKPTEELKETPTSKTPGRFILSGQCQVLSAHHFGKETRRNKMKSTGAVLFSSDTDGGSGLLDDQSHGKFTSSISPYFLSYNQRPDFKAEKPNPKPETLITRSWVTACRLWEYYPQLCLMAVTGLLSTLNTVLSRRSYSRKRISYSLRTHKMKTLSITPDYLVSLKQPQYL